MRIDYGPLMSNDGFFRNVGSNPYPHFMVA